MENILIHLLIYKINIYGVPYYVAGTALGARGSVNKTKY